MVKAAQKALQTNNVNLVLIWVQKVREPELKAVFQQTLAVRKLSPESKALADRHLFETLVRLHREGEAHRTRVSSRPDAISDPPFQPPTAPSSWERRRRLRRYS